MKFIQYHSKPLTRMAFQITPYHLCAKISGEEDVYIIADNLNGPWIKFKSTGDPEHGDWIVRVSEDNTYCCTDAMFRESFIVPSPSLRIPSEE